VKLNTKLALPYKDQNTGKKQQVATMFDNISGNYDFLNHFLSAGIDIYWRGKAVKELKKINPKIILDVATGTSDFAIAALETGADKIIGIDISEGMLSVGRKKIENLGLQNKIELRSGDCENLLFEDNYFDAVIVAFGVRNFENLEKGLSNIYRVLKDGGTVIVLEFSKPSFLPVKYAFNFYFKFILPFIGRLISKDQAAYSYLPESVGEFPYGKQFVNILNKTGFKSTKCTKLTFGISSLYIGRK
jgi:demethylmenaquinone methyltransferase/2-methoxy-6-polyprenyl-1,4-benzoquinol methylase